MLKECGSLIYCPIENKREVTWSKQDQASLSMLEEKSTCIKIDGVSRYSTVLLRKKSAAPLPASPAAVLPLLRATERRLASNPELAKVYNQEIHKLEESGYADKITSEEISSWSVTSGNPAQISRARCCNQWRHTWYVSPNQTPPRRPTTSPLPLVWYGKK